MPDNRLHPITLRVLHWLSALAIFIMIGSGWKIYNDQPLLYWLRFPELLTIGGDPNVSMKVAADAGFGGALQWHFFAMWLLALAWVGYIIYGLATRRFRRMLLPIRPEEVLSTSKKALRLRLRHRDVTTYNAVQRLLYLLIVVGVIVQMLAGLAIWKPVQLSWLADLFGGYQPARYIHFAGMIAICIFLVIHIALALIVPRTLAAMITGGPRSAIETHPKCPIQTRQREGRHDLIFAVTTDVPARPAK